MSRPEPSILLVDDVPNNLQVLSEILIREGYRIRPVTSGDLALRTIAAELPSLILADIKMPGMDGFELCRRLKAAERTRAIPVIFISALGETKDKVAAFEVGGVDYITKPFQGAEVLARVRTHLAVHQLSQTLQDTNRILEARVQERTGELSRNLETLRDTRATLNLVLDTMPHPIFWKDIDGRYLGCNRMFAEMIGLRSPANIQGMTDFDLPWPAADAEAYRADDQQVLSQNRPRLNFVEQLTGPNGERVWIRTSKAPMSGPDGVPFALLGVFQDISLQVRAEQARSALLEISEASQGAATLAELFAKIHTIVAALFVADNFYIAIRDERTGNISFPYFVDETDAAPAPRRAGRTLTDLVLDSGQPRLLRRRDIERRTAAGAIQVHGTVPESWLGVPLIGARGTFGAVVLQTYRPGSGYSDHDIEIFQFVGNQIAACIQRKQAEDDTRKLEAQLIQSQKMESLGSLAGGVAHDMNNVLAAILAMASAHLAIEPEASAAHQAFATIAEAAMRGGGMVKGLLNFARQSPVEQKEIDLNGILQEEVRLLERTVLAKVIFELDLAPDLKTIRGDGNALNHAIMNLCVNAVDAMGEGGKLSLRTRNAEPGSVEVQVLDTGSGMPREVLEKALDPFFTTKGIGKGTGLGLALVYSTMKAHGGGIEIRSEPGLGTQVTLTFPRAAAPATGPDPAPAAPAESLRPTLRLLLVDDDELVLKSTQLLLEVMGHSVTAFPCGEDALAFLQHAPAPQAVILDMNMPGLGGQGTLAQLRVRYPELPVLLATGRADQAALDLVQAHPHVTLLSKPYSIEHLSGLLQALGGPGTRNG
jgi:PAS domain S-box-containing protein